MGKKILVCYKVVIFRVAGNAVQLFGGENPSHDIRLALDKENSSQNLDKAVHFIILSRLDYMSFTNSRGRAVPRNVAQFWRLSTDSLI
jgi:hypothetical protein